MPLFKKTLPDWMRARLSTSHRFLVLCIVCGIGCGLMAVAFHLGLEFLFESIYSRARSFGSPHFEGVMVAAPAFAGLLVGLAVHFFAPSAIGGGIPQTREAYYNKDGYIPLLAGVWRFLLSLLYLGFGNSLGRTTTVRRGSGLNLHRQRVPSLDHPRNKKAGPAGPAVSKENGCQVRASRCHGRKTPPPHPS